jgi:hypothetical protein
MNKAKVRSAGKEISSSLYEARNMALHGVTDGSNVSIGLVFDSSEENKNKIHFYSYPHSFSGAQIIPILSDEIQLLKTYTLQP